MKTPIRVRVWSRHLRQEVGLGTLEEYVTVYCVQWPGGMLVPLPDAERCPTEAEVAAIKVRGGLLVEWPGNPKIKLDSGRVVYGCLVHWSYLPAQAVPNPSGAA